MMASLHKQHYDASAPQEWPIVRITASKISALSLPP
jgi:hypothetical protein